MIYDSDAKKSTNRCPRMQDVHLRDLGDVVDYRGKL